MPVVAHDQAAASHEIDAVAWLPLPQAIDRLSYAHDADVIASLQPRTTVPICLSAHLDDATACLSRRSTAVNERGIATMRGYRLSLDDLIRRAVIGRLLCHTVIPKHEVEREFSISFDEYFSQELPKLEEFRSEGLVILEPGEIRVTALGRIFIRNVAMTFDRYLREQQMDQRPLFSKTL